MGYFSTDSDDETPDETPFGFRYQFTLFLLTSLGLIWLLIAILRG